MAKPAEVTTPEQTELLAVTRTHSGALTRYTEGKSLKKYSTSTLHSQI